MKENTTNTTTTNTTKEETTMMNATNTTTNKELVNVSVLQATSNKDIAKSIRADLAKVEGMAFKVAVKGAYLTGEKVPCGNGMIDNPNPVSRKDFYTLVNKSKATLSRWIKAVLLIVENGLFNDFNSGKFPFSFDKVIIILTDDELKKGNFAELMSMSVTSLENMTKSDESGKSDESTDGDESGDESDESATGETVEFTYNGNVYTVDKGIIEKFIAENCEMK